MKLAQNITLFLSILLCIGLVYISFFNVYQTDDYIYSYSTKTLGIAGNIRDFYMNWGGRYFGYTINMFTPLSKDPENILPKIYPIFLFFAFIGVSALNFKQYFKYSLRESIVKGLLLFFFYTVLLVNISEHYYWFTGSNVYFLPTILSGFLLFLYGKFRETGKKIWFYLSLLLIAILMGSNEILALILLGILVYFNTQNKSKEARILLAVGCVGILVTFLAPGNFKRLIDLDEPFYRTWLRRIAFSVANTGYISIKVLLLLPFFIKVFEKELNEIKSKINIKKALIIWSISFLPLIFLGYLMNIIGRQFEHIIFFYLLSFSVVTMFKFEKIKKFWWISCVVIFLPETNFFPQNYANFNLDFNVNNLTHEVLQTDLKTYDQEIENRVYTLKNSSQDSVILDKIKTIPKVLYFGELSSVNEPRGYVNMQQEKYFDKKYIRTK
ncbi:hypothetical protein J3D55_000367 [Chryseobacterium ginsenosidimutans]|uniref:DUF6056 family protein n=1 Tax=Chryseobacterium ginsenosidimutans TaxID=687846 RepID=UPI00216914A8|nr:DUF6056 family protein [Chryseobacterium ginsenosidimutans]MCS3867451.1 hypothetical protein [Chryseobacterium ginsenosidimutans]